MSWARGNNDAEAFADALEGRVPTGGDVQQLVRLAESLCEAAVDPSPDFVLSLRADLMADASSVLVVAPKTLRTATTRPVPHPVRKRLAAVTAGLLATAGIVGIVSSSAQALPGEMLYPVKRGVESIELALHRSDASRGSFQLSQATERLAEAGSLTKNGDTRTDQLVVKSLTEFADQASVGSEALFSDYADSGSNASVDKVTKFATISSAVLASLSGRLSPNAADVFKVAASTVTDLASQATTLCAACNSAELTSLASTNKAGTSKPVTTDTVSKGTVSTDKGSTGKGSASATPGTSGLTSSLPPIVALPASPTPDTIGAGTDPLTGTLTGGDDQGGLVSGLLGNVLK